MYIKVIRLHIDDFRSEIVGEYNCAPDEVKTPSRGDNEVIIKVTMGGDPVQEQTKVYIQVLARVTPSGYIVPTQIRWVDRRWIKIDQVIECRDMRETKQGGDGWRYRVRIGGQVVELYQQPDRRWYVISDTAVGYGDDWA